ncbi:hypothetical protein [Marinagarivorans algicola]|uniref:hypothetical protein n=1 Tax=Marinagarivorans algicola TaxID=1513270 RepID=UPI0037370BA5
MLYKKEFGDDFDLGFNLNAYPYLKDKSWHNDVSPSFYFNIGPQYYVLWADYADTKKREYPSERYSIQQANNEGNTTSPEIYCDEGDIVFKSESFDNISHYLQTLTSHNTAN